MSRNIRELLPLYALGILDADEASDVEREVARDAALAAELASYQEAADVLPAGIQPVAPAPHVLQRLLASAGGGRFEAVTARIARMYDVTIERARELLALIERPASWRPQIPGLALVDFDGGPAAAAADCGFFRLSPGAMFPPHTHLGEEASIVLAGQIRDMANNRVLVAGEDYLQTQGSKHFLMCVGDEDCIYAACAINGIDLFGTGTRARPIN
jgi:putative transcriptional regulator